MSTEQYTIDIIIHVHRQLSLIHSVSVNNQPLLQESDKWT